VGGLVVGESIERDRDAGREVKKEKKKRKRKGINKKAKPHI